MNHRHEKSLKNNALVNKKNPPFILNHAWIVVVFDVWEMNQFHHGSTMRPSFYIKVYRAHHESKKKER